MNSKRQTNPRAVEAIADYVTGLRFEALTDQTIIRARQIILDFIGTALGGYQTSLGERVSEFAAEVFAGQQAKIIGDGRSSTVEGAAWANAIMSCVLSMSETHRLCGHVASEVVPVALALGEKHRIDGRNLIVSLVAGYDVFGALQPAVKSSQRERGLDHKGHVGTLASAVTASVALGFDHAKLANALALSVDLACGTEQYTFDAGLCDTEGLVAGYAARNGVHAAQMADYGFRGPPGALDGSYGYFNAYGNGYNPSILDNLGKVSVLEGAGFKPHSGCRHVHACVDATQNLLSQGKPPLDEIASIRVGTYLNAVTPEFRCSHYPADFDAAGYSLPATVAVVLARGSWYREDIQAYDQPHISRLRPLVTVYLDEDIETGYPQSAGCVVTVVTKDGTEYTGRTDYPKGEPENMLTDEEFETKFRRLTGNLLPDEQIEQLFGLLSQVEELDDIGRLMRLTSKL